MLKFVYKKKYLPLNKEIRCALQIIKGIGWHKSILITTKIGLGYPYKINKINKYLFVALEQVLNSCTWLEVRLRRLVNSKIGELVSIKCYRGFRHKENLPVRGQRTRTNAGTQKRKKYKYYV